MGGSGSDRVRSLDRAGPDALSFAVSARYAADLDSSKAGAVLVPEALASGAGPGTRIVVADPYGALVQVLHALYPSEPHEAGTDPTARIGAGAAIGPEVSIGPYAVLGRNVQRRRTLPPGTGGLDWRWRCRSGMTPPWDRGWCAIRAPASAAAWW